MDSRFKPEEVPEESEGVIQLRLTHVSGSHEARKEQTMKRIFIPTKSPDDWRQFLADPQKHWRTGFSAKTLAYCWENADGFPPEVARLFSDSGIPCFQNVLLLLALPEYQVSLPGGRRASHNDIFALAKAHDGHLMAIAIEGKVSEGFGQTIGEWNLVKSQGRKIRLEFLKEQLGLANEVPSHIRYQLLHRTVSALIEAVRFNAASAVMIVHSFSQANEGFEDYEAFLALFGAKASLDQLVLLTETHGISLYCGWVRGNVKYLGI
jgi:hypothetical protein